MCQTRKFATGDHLDKWIAAQEAINTSGQGRRAWRNTPRRASTRMYWGVVLVLVLVIVVAALAR
jgi:hypothetical protein